jgi:hypothetical protein
MLRDGGVRALDKAVGGRKGALMWQDSCDPRFQMRDMGYPAYSPRNPLLCTPEGFWPEGCKLTSKDCLTFVYRVNTLYR